MFLFLPLIVELLKLSYEILACQYHSDTAIFNPIKHSYTLYLNLQSKLSINMVIPSCYIPPHLSTPHLPQPPNVVQVKQVHGVRGFPHLDDGRDQEGAVLVHGVVIGVVVRLEGGGHEDHLHVGAVGTQQLPHHQQAEVRVLVALVNLVG